MYILRTIPDDDHQRHVLPDGGGGGETSHSQDRSIYHKHTGIFDVFLNLTVVHIVYNLVYNIDKVVSIHVV